MPALSYKMMSVLREVKRGHPFQPEGGTFRAYEAGNTNPTCNALEKRGLIEEAPVRPRDSWATSWVLTDAGREALK